MIFIAVVAAAMAGLTWIVGWWGVLIAALIIGFVFRAEGGGGWRIAVAGALAWAGLLVLDALSGPFGVLGQRLAGVTRVPALVLVLMTIALPAGLAWSGATVVAALTRHRFPVSGRRFSDSSPVG
jgi:hypothetical protein